MTDDAGHLTVPLHIEAVGPSPARLVFLHGLFGRGRNWTTVARALATLGHGSLLIDLPDHGRSGWTARFDYDRYTAIVADALRQRTGDGRVILVGHSLGGKVAMLAALRHPELLDGLVVVDIAPTRSRAVAGFVPLVEAMRSLDVDSLGSRADADRALRERVPDDAVRLFLLQNLRSTPAWHWQPNLAMLGRSLDAVASWPHVTGHYDGPVLWLRGGSSPYVTEADEPAMRALFPHVRLMTVPGASHWVQADQPRAVVDALATFAVSLSQPSPR